MTTAQRELLSLLRAALTGAGSFDARATDWRALLESARFAHVAAAAAVGLMGSPAWRGLPPEAQRAFQSEWETSVLAQVRQADADARIGPALAQAGVRYCPLKGLSLRALYPAPEMRDMVDLDYLVQRKQQAAARRAMLALGYRSEGVAGVHEGFAAEGEPVVEIHTALLSLKSDYGRALADPWPGLRPDPDAPLRCAMPPDMEYLYLILHMEKHLSQAGLGLRDVMDVFLYRRAHEGELAPADEALSRAGLLPLARNVERLGACWFGGAEEDESLRTIGDFVLESGVHGTDQQSVLQLMLRGQPTDSKGRYVLSRLFPSARVIRSDYPVLERAPWLLPACWVRQWGRQLLALRGETAKQWRLLQSVDQRALESHRAAIDALYGATGAHGGKGGG